MHWKYKDGTKSPILTGAKVMRDAEILTVEITSQEAYKGVRWDDLQMPSEILAMGGEHLFSYIRGFSRMEDIYINFFHSLLK